MTVQSANLSALLFPLTSRVFENEDEVNFTGPCPPQRLKPLTVYIPSLNLSDPAQRITLYACMCLVLTRRNISQECLPSTNHLFIYHADNSLDLLQRPLTRYFVCYELATIVQAIEPHSVDESSL
jgi:hypothetical protein